MIDEKLSPEISRYMRLTRVSLDEIDSWSLKLARSSATAVAKVREDAGAGAEVLISELIARGEWLDSIGSVRWAISNHEREARAGRQGANVELPTIQRDRWRGKA